MGLISTEVEVGIYLNDIKRYENLGYIIPRYKNKQGKMVVDRNSKITIKVEHLRKYSNILVDIQCDYCKKIYKTTMANYQKINHDGQTYCCHCVKKIFSTGENNSNYNPLLTQEERECKRNYIEYAEFIKRVLYRDNFTCKCCGATRENSGSSMQVHHLDGYNWCKEKRTDVTNGITLCETCHQNFHIKYGRGDNTKKQFEEWIEQVSIELRDYNGVLQTARKIYCYEEDKVYNSVKEYCCIHNIKYYSRIYDICNHSSRNYTFKGKHFFWYDEYVLLTQEEIFKCINRESKVIQYKIICLNTLIVYDSINEAERQTGFNSIGISKCCKNKQSYCGKLSDGTKLKWMYHDDYLKTLENKQEEELSNENIA